MLRGLTTQLIREGRVTTTKARAKALRDEAERMITLAKEGSLASRRRAIGYIFDKQLVHALFDKAPDRYGDRNGGYTRIIPPFPVAATTPRWRLSNWSERAWPQAPLPWPQSLPPWHLIP